MKITEFASLKRGDVVKVKIYKMPGTCGAVKTTHELMTITSEPTERREQMPASDTKGRIRISVNCNNLLGRP